MIGVSLAMAGALSFWGPQTPGTRWMERLLPQDWPYLATDATFGAAMFAKTSPGVAGSPYVQVLVRQEFRVAQKNPDRANGRGRPSYRSEVMDREIDCTARAYRNLKTSRYPRNNLLGEAEVFQIRNRDWTPPEKDTLEEVVLQAVCDPAPALAPALLAP